MKRLMAGIVLVSVPSLPALALAGTWTIDPAHTSVTFKIRHLFTKVEGVFATVEGAITFDPADPGTGAVEASIDAASVNTRNERRDADLRSANFFEVGKFPKITFKSTKVEKTEAGTLKLTGDLSMHGVTKPITLDVEFLGTGPHLMPGTQVAGFSATGKLDRKDFGIVWNQVLDSGGTLLGDEVEIRLDIEADQKAATP